MDSASDFDSEGYRFKSCMGLKVFKNIVSISNNVIKCNLIVKQFRKYDAIFFFSIIYD